VLASLNQLSLEGWALKTAALPQQFSEARKQADKLLEPKTQHIKVSSGILHTPQDVEAWIAETKQQIFAKLGNGPIVIS
jgi:hypothetical protein